MFSANMKGGVLLKILIVAACILLILSVEVPRRMWNAQKEREALAHERMVSMNDCQLVYRQETNHFNKDLKKVYDFVNNNLLKVNAADIELEFLTVDSTNLRISFNDYKHIADLDVKDLKGQPPVKSAEQGISDYDIIHDPVKGFVIGLKNKDSKLGLASGQVTLTSESPITATARYKKKDDIYWDFESKTPIRTVVRKLYTISQDLETEKTKSFLTENGFNFSKESMYGKNNLVWLTFDEYKMVDGELGEDNKLTETQKVHMGRYVLSDPEDDEPYLCPSTRDPFKVSYNLAASVGMKVSFFKGDKVPEGYENELAQPVSSNDKVKEFFKSIVRRKAERSVTDFVREYEIDGDSSYSSDEKKTELFGKYVTEWLQENGSKEPISEQDKKSLNSTDKEYNKDFSKEMRFNKFFGTPAGEKIDNEINKPENVELLSQFNYVYQTFINKIDTVSVKLECPIDENSSFSGIKRNFLQKMSVFGIDNDDNHGYIDDGRVSWKKD